MTDPFFAPWRLFRRWPGWVLARGCPPTVWHTRRMVRGARVAVLAVVLALISSWLSTAWPIVGWLGEQLPLPGDGEFGLVFWPGVVFGVVVLIPLSRWSGRNWWWSVAAVPVSTALYFIAVHAFFEHHSILGGNAGDAIRAGLIAGAIGGVGIGLWMLKPLRPQTWWLAPVSGFVGAVGGLTTGVMWHGDGLSLPSQVDWLGQVIGMNLCFSPFQVGVAVAVTPRVWWSPQAPARMDDGDVGVEPAG